MAAGGVSRRVRSLGGTWLTVVAVVVGLLVTASVSWTARVVNDHNEHRLLELQTKQAVELLKSTVLSISSPLSTALQIAEASDGSVADFDRYLSSSVGPQATFFDASLWDTRGGSPARVATLGASPATATAEALIARASHSTTFVVTHLGVAGTERIGYAIADPRHPGFAVYAERAIPADRQVSVESNAAFSELDYATYLGSVADATTLATTDVPPSRLPLTRGAIRVALPFGDTTLILVTAARGQLGGGLGADLPAVFAVGGFVLTAITAAVVQQLVYRRRRAERDAATISGLYGELDVLYGNQRSIAETLQSALLPTSSLSLPAVEVATRYVAGAEGVDIGGDWYSVDQADDHRLLFVVGDVSGQGVEAAAIMARLRFTLRAYLLEGHGPAVALDMCAAELDIAADGHIATALVGSVDVRTGQLLLANAGHLEPLVISTAGTSYATTEAGPPLGLGWSGYEQTATRLAPDATLVAFTDGLVERRAENIDAGLARLARVAVKPSETVEGLLGHIIETLTADGHTDDVALLAFRLSPTVLDAAADQPAVSDQTAMSDLPAVSDQPAGVEPLTP
jgi:serine phosphatase RsbU (regulator of sigma subunit)